MVGDEILGSRAISMPGFAQVVDQLIARAYARGHRQITRSGGAEVDLGWTEAKEALERAVHRHGRDGRAPALVELGDRSELLVRFVERVRWAALCEQPMRFAEHRYAQLWADLVQNAKRAGEENVV